MYQSATTHEREDVDHSRDPCAEPATCVMNSLFPIYLCVLCMYIIVPTYICNMMCIAHVSFVHMYLVHE